ncbi:hypothetical protein, partial [Pseudomonas sp. 78_B]|uniref:hypothetical protein n=1 Tax=Pseudomonas sp. 78_B TaxID=2813566 RepID=UPI001A9EACED
VLCKLLERNETARCKRRIAGRRAIGADGGRAGAPVDPARCASSRADSEKQERNPSSPSSNDTANACAGLTSRKDVPINTNAAKRT